MWLGLAKLSLGVLCFAWLSSAVGCGDDAVLPPPAADGGGGGGGVGGTGGAADGGGGMGGMLGNGFAEPCTVNEDCEPGFCIPEQTTGWPGGYCSELCNDLAPCATPGTQCVDIGSGEFCLRDCIPSGSGTECAPYQSCFDLGNGAGVCGPGCTTDSHCPVLGKCGDDGVCIEPEDCADQLDNDLDGLTDCEDPECSPSCGVAVDSACGSATASTATQSGDTTMGTSLFAGSCTGTGGALEDLYAYTASSAGLLSLRLDSVTDQGIYLRSGCDDAATELACADAVIGGSTEVVYFPVSNGDTMTIFVDGYQSPLEAGPYTLDLAVIPLTVEQENNDALGVANAHVDGTAFSGGIAMSDNDWIAVTVPGPASTLTAEVVAGGSNSCSGDIDSELQLLGTDGTTELAFNDDISPFGNFCSRATAADLAAGVYFLRVASSQAFCMDCTFDYSVIISLQ